MDVGVPPPGRVLGRDVDHLMLRVAPNDAGLAHAVSRAGIAALADRSAALYERLQGNSVKDISRILRRHFGELVLIEDIIRAIGSRANARWLVLDADRDGEGLAPLRVDVRYAGGYGTLNVLEYKLRITRHTIARLVQRTLHHNIIAASGPILLHHLAQAHALVESGGLHYGDQVRTASPEGVLLWEVRRIDGELLLRAQTWVAAAMAGDERIREDCSTWATRVVRSR